jgi:hypothetical protein
MVNRDVWRGRRKGNVPSGIIGTVMYGRDFGKFEKGYVEIGIVNYASGRGHGHFFGSLYDRGTEWTVIIEVGNDGAGHLVHITERRVFEVIVQAMRGGEEVRLAIGGGIVDHHAGTGRYAVDDQQNDTSPRFFRRHTVAVTDESGHTGHLRYIVAGFCTAKTAIAVVHLPYPQPAGERYAGRFLILKYQVFSLHRRNGQDTEVRVVPVVESAKNVRPIPIIEEELCPFGEFVFGEKNAKRTSAGGTYPQPPELHAVGQTCPYSGIVGVKVGYELVGKTVTSSQVILFQRINAQVFRQVERGHFLKRDGGGTT